MKSVILFYGIFMLVFGLFTTTAFAQDQDERLKALEEQVG